MTDSPTDTLPETLTLGISPYPNDTFAFSALIHGQIDGAPPVSVSHADIDVLNGWAADGELDIVKVSYAALPDLLDRYALLPSGGALGRGCGPLVVVGDRESLEGARVAIPGRRTTAYLLFQLWALEQGVDAIEVMPFDKIMPAVAEGVVDAGLIIHESRFTYPSYGLNALVDLGKWWEAQTGLAIPLGAVVARRSLDLDAISRAIRASVEHAWADPTASRGYVIEHAQEMAPEVVDAHIGLYVNTHTADLGEDGYDAVDGLLSRAVSLGLVPPLAGRLR